MTYRLETLVRDASLRRSLRRSLCGDGKLSHQEVRRLLVAALDGKGVRKQEYDDLQAILRHSRTLGENSKRLIRRFLVKYYVPPKKKTAAPSSAGGTRARSTFR